jgi:hypothetical protein
LICTPRSSPPSVLPLTSTTPPAADSTRRANVQTTLLLLPAPNAALLADLCGFLHATADAHPQPRDATRALAAAFAGLIGRDSAPTLEGVLSDAPYAILLTAILIEHHRSLFSATAALDAEADADARRFRAQMEASYKRLRANMSSAYKAERAELRQKHSEQEISALMQRRADKVRTGTLDSTSLEAVERLAAASRAASVAAAGDSQRSALSSTGGSAVVGAGDAAASRATAGGVAAAAASGGAAGAAHHDNDDDDDDYGDFADFLNSSSSDAEDSDSVATNTTTHDDDDSVSADVDDKPRRARSHQVGAPSASVSLNKSDRMRGMGSSGERTSAARPVSPLVHEAAPRVAAAAPVVSAAVDWSSDEASEEVVTSMLDEVSPRAKGAPPVVPPAPRVESPAPPAPPPPLSEEAEKAKRRLSVTAAVEASSLKQHRKSREKDKSSSRKSASSSKSSTATKEKSAKKSKHKEKKDLIVYNPKNDSHSAPKRMGRQVRTIAAVGDDGARQAVVRRRRRRCHRRAALVDVGESAHRRSHRSDQARRRRGCRYGGRVVDVAPQTRLQRRRRRRRDRVDGVDRGLCDDASTPSAPAPESAPSGRRQ